MLAVPEISRTVMLPRSSRKPRENELGRSYLKASFRAFKAVIGFFVMVRARETSSSTSFMVIGNTPVLMNSYSVAQACGCGDPDVFAIEIDAEDVMMRRGGIGSEARNPAGGVADQHFGLAR